MIRDDLRTAVVCSDLTISFFRPYRLSPPSHPPPTSDHHHEPLTTQDVDGESIVKLHSTGSPKVVIEFDCRSVHSKSLVPTDVMILRPR